MNQLDDINIQFFFSIELRKQQNKNLTESKFI